MLIDTGGRGVGVKEGGQWGEDDHGVTGRRSRELTWMSRRETYGV